MRLSARVLLVATVLTLPLGGCAGVDLDPGELFAFDFLNTKKPLPGERKPVFPEGVPGASRGIPQELMKGDQSQLVAEPEPVLATQPAAVVEEPKARPKAKPKPKPSVAARPPAEPQDDGVWPQPPRQQPKQQPPRQQQQPQQQQPQQQQQGQQPPPQRPQPQQQVQWPDSPPPRQQPQAQWPDPPSGRPQAAPQVQWPDPPAPR